MDRKFHKVLRKINHLSKRAGKKSIMKISALQEQPNEQGDTQDRSENMKNILKIPRK